MLQSKIIRFSLLSLVLCLSGYGLGHAWPVKAANPEWVVNKDQLQISINTAELSWGLQSWCCQNNTGLNCRAVGGDTGTSPNGQMQIIDYDSFLNRCSDRKYLFTQWCNTARCTNQAYAAGGAQTWPATAPVRYDWDRYDIVTLTTAAALIVLTVVIAFI